MGKNEGTTCCTGPWRNVRAALFEGDEKGGDTKVKGKRVETDYRERT